MAHLTHPLRLWRDAQGITLIDVADRLAANGGGRPSVAYLKHVEGGVDSPGWTLAKRIAALIGADPVAIKEWRRGDVAPPEVKAAGWAG